MDALPLEFYLSIFDYLDLNDLLTMRLVCKRIESAIREFRIQELTCLDYHFYRDFPENFLQDFSRFPSCEMQ